MNDIPANIATDVEFKTVTNPSFLALMYEVEEHLSYGWRIHQKIAPVDTFTNFEVVLYKDIHTITRARDRIQKIIDTRAEAVKEDRQAGIPKMNQVRRKKIAERKSGEAVQGMLASIEKVREGGDEG